MSLQGSQKQIGRGAPGTYPDVQDKLLVAPSRSGPSQPRE